MSAGTADRDGMSTNIETLPSRLPLSWPGSAETLLDNSLLVALVALVGSILVGLGGEVLVADSWLTLASGREIVQHGLPHHEILTTIPRGRVWTDQQWLAQLVFYGLDVLGGLRLALLFNAFVVTSTVALAVGAARRRGASARSTLIVAAFCVWVAPWAWQLRAQALALPLFVLVLRLAASDVDRPRRMTFLALPLLALWANIHGSVVVGAGIVSLAGLVGLARRMRGIDGAPSPTHSITLSVAPWLSILVSPYHLHLVGYYRLMLIDSPVAKYITEWKAPSPHGWLTAFFVIAGVIAVVALWQWRRLSLYDKLVLAATLAGSLRSGRGIVWFMLATMVLLPRALDGVLPPHRVRIRRRVSTVALAICVAGASVALGVVTTRPSSWFEQNWPVKAAEAVANAAKAVEQPGAVYPSDKHADWLLWKEPSLRGRLAYDVRFEFFNDAEIRSFVRFKSFRSGWDRVAAPYPIVVFDRTEAVQRQIDFLRSHGAKTLYADRTIVVLKRARAA